MKSFVSSYIDYHFKPMLDFIVVRILTPNIIGLFLIVCQISIFIMTWQRQVSQALTVEALGLPAITQAEIVIVAGLLGIVATTAMPPFMDAQQKNMLLIKLQRDYAIYSNAMGTALNENGTIDTWGSSNPDGKTTLANINENFVSQFKVIKNCGTEPGCFPDLYYRNLKGILNETDLNRDPLYTKFRLADGSSVAISLWSSTCDINWGDSVQLKNVCGVFVDDVNGDKWPNQYGIDVFGFALTRFGLVPLGSEMQRNYPLSGFCSNNSNANFKYENGLSCTAWALYNQNMEYTKCNGLNWKGKTSCSAK